MRERREPTGKRERLDQALVQRGFFETRRRAQAAIMEGKVSVDGLRATKAGQAVFPGSRIDVKGGDAEFVSRGGDKLSRALDVFGIDPSGKAAIDIGASTGGFTDCLLRRGASRVYALDVGYGLLSLKLRRDPRVTVLERVNARYLDVDLVPDEVDLVTVDVSFISAAKILPAIARVVSPEAEVLILVKPQFEAGRELVGRGGVVKDPEIHRQVLLAFAEKAVTAGFRVKGVTYSWPPGPSGNLEFWTWLSMRRPHSEETLRGEGEGKTGKAANDDVRPGLDAAVRRVVEEAHSARREMR